MYTQAIRTFLGSDELGSLTLTKANWMRPSENSSIRSSNSPSAFVRQRSSLLHNALQLLRHGGGVLRPNLGWTGSRN